MEVEELTKQKAQLEKQMAVYQRRMEDAPLNEQKYASLVNDLNLAKADYDEKVKRQQASDTAQNVEEHKAGEQLEMLDSPNVPDKAIEPDRWIWAGAGAFIGLLCGAGAGRRPGSEEHVSQESQGCSGLYESARADEHSSSGEHSPGSQKAAPGLAGMVGRDHRGRGFDERLGVLLHDQCLTWAASGESR